MNETTQTADVRGTSNRVYLSQRDIHVSEHYVQAQTRFSATDLLDVQWPGFESPRIATDLVRQVLRMRLLVLGGHDLREKSALARHVAWRLQQELSDDSDEVPVHQWHPSSAAQSLENAFDDYDETTVFVFLSLRPHHLAYDLRRLQENLDGHRHYAIVATDSTLSDWSLDGATEPEVWRPLKQQQVYDEPYLCKLLVKRLEEVRGNLPEGLLPDSLPPGGPSADTPLVGSLTLRAAARRLETPSRVRSFVAMLATQRGDVASEAWVADKLEQHSGSRDAVHKWYRQFDDRGQLLALGLAFFDGLFDDQVFAALETLVEACWRKLDPSLAHFDYHELGRLGAYFRGIAGGRISRIEAWAPEHRQAVFEVAWRLHRRRMLATLPWIVQMVRDSAQGSSASGDGLRTLSALGSQERDAGTDAGSETGAAEPSETEDGELSEQETRLSRWYGHGPGRDLFGSPVRCVQIRRAAAETLGQLGRFSVEAIERSLLDLAEDGRRDVQIVAAVAMANWRAAEPRDAASTEESSRDERSRRLFRTLSAWQNEAFSKEFSQRLRRRWRAADAFAHIRATVALTVGYASLFDPPGHLSGELEKLLEQLLDDRHPHVRDRFRTQTLPIIVASHLKQLEELLREKVLREADLLYAVATGVALASGTRPQEARQVLEDWRAETGRMPRRPEAEGEAPHREKLLATIALAYGRIRPAREGHERRGEMTAGEIFKTLQQILNQEASPFVRNAVLLAMTFQTHDGPPGGGANDSFRQVASHLRDFLGEVTLEERPLVVDWLTRLYLEQRRKLKKNRNGKPYDDKVRTDGGAYPVWIRSERSLTEVERVLYGWLLSSSHPAAQQVAMSAFAAFGETPLEIEERARKARSEEDDPSEEKTADEGTADPPETPKSLVRLHRSSLRERLTLLIVAPMDKRRRRVVSALLPEYLALRRGLGADSERDAGQVLELLLARWEDVPNAGIRETARYLRRAVRVHAWGWRFLGGLFTVALVASLVLAYFVWK